eukprot:GFUD01129614.1.p1 GENE.GFUD01129614.1~~GFUD01129614.1.p1  ORF type:complete len:117 (+),score=0.48 GFUD01129614.1:525-875(+)
MVLAHCAPPPPTLGKIPEKYRFYFILLALLKHNFLSSKLQHVFHIIIITTNVLYQHTKENTIVVYSIITIVNQTSILFCQQLKHCISSKNPKSKLLKLSMLLVYNFYIKTQNCTRL